MKSTFRGRPASIYEDRYRRYFHNKLERYTCFYCGEKADTFDHVPPISRVADYESLGLKHEVYLKVPACRECNCLAGSELQPTIIERKEYIADKLARRFATAMRMPEWDEDEVNELRGMLKEEVRAGMRMRKFVADRIQYYDGVDQYLEDFDELCVERH